MAQTQLCMPFRVENSSRETLISAGEGSRTSDPYLRGRTAHDFGGQQQGTQRSKLACQQVIGAQPYRLQNRSATSSLHCPAYDVHMPNCSPHILYVQPVANR